MTNWAKAALVLSVGLCPGGTGSALSEEQKCPESDSGISLPTGFCATIFADKVGHARQLVVAPEQHAGTMPPLGGVALSDNDVAAVAAYVWAIGHQKKS